MSQALLVIDIQNDFCSGGSLEVPDGEKIIPTVNKLIDYFDTIIQTQDWHPEGHNSFASSHNGKDPFEEITVDYGKQTLWPDHCVQGTGGSEFHPELDTTQTDMIVRKGFREDVDSYSAFYENDGKTKTGLTGYLNDRSIDTLYLVGLATDYCVKWSAVDAVEEGFDVGVVMDAVKGIDIEGSVESSWNEMVESGVSAVSSEEFLDY